MADEFPASPGLLCNTGVMPPLERQRYHEDHL